MNFTVSFSEVPSEFHVSFGETAGGGETFAGSYLVTPSLARQTLLTAHKSMAADVTVMEIPYFEVTNEQCGRTVIIGGNEYV